MTDAHLAALRARLAGTAPGATRRVLELAEEALAAELGAREGLAGAVDGAVTAFEALAARARAGEEQALGALIGRVRKLNGGKGDPQFIRSLILAKLGVDSGAGKG